MGMLEEGLGPQGAAKSLGTSVHKAALTSTSQTSTTFVGCASVWQMLSKHAVPESRSVVQDCVRKGCCPQHRPTEMLGQEQWAMQNTDWPTCTIARLTCLTSRCPSPEE